MRRPGGLRQVLEDSNVRHPDKTAILYAGESYTYAQLEAASQALAGGLLAQGLRPQENVLLCLGNRIETVCAFWGVLKAGGVVVNVDPQISAANLEHVLHDCEASLLITTSTTLASLPSSIAGLPHLRAIVLLDGAPGVRATLTFEDLLNQQAWSPSSVAALDDDLAMIFYPGEGTEAPRGVMASQRNVLAALDSLRSNLAYEVTDNILCSLPLSTDYGLYQMLMAVAAGATLVLEKSSNAALPLMDSIERHQVSVVPFVANTLTLLHDHATRRGIDFPGVRLVIDGGAGLRPRQISRMNSLFPNARISTLYGLPECRCCTCLPAEDLYSKPGSIGIAVTDTEAWLIDDQGQAIDAPRRPGQLVIRSAAVTPGYWRDPLATAQRLKPGSQPGDVVLHTGDLCSRDEDGYLYRHGSLRHLIRSAGTMVNPQDVEQFLLALEGVRDAAVVGIADTERGQALWAFVVVDPAQRTADVGELLEQCRVGLATWQVPVGITFKTILPSTGSGRVDLVLLQQWACNEQTAVAR